MARVEEQQTGVGVGLAGKHVLQRMVGATQQEVAHRGEGRQWQMRCRRRLSQDSEHVAIAGHGKCDAFVDRRLVAELRVAEPTPKCSQIIDGVTHPVRPVVRAV